MFFAGNGFMNSDWGHDGRLPLGDRLSFEHDTGLKAHRHRRQPAARQRSRSDASGYERHLDAHLHAATAFAFTTVPASRSLSELPARGGPGFGDDRS